LISRFFSTSLIVLALLSFSAFGQADATEGGGGGPPGNYEIGFHLGDLLPNQIQGVSEIMSLGGIRGAYRFAQAGWIETGFMTGNEDGQTWRDLHGDLRMDIPVENLIAFATVGLDAVQYSGPTRSSILNLGGHVGGGIQVPIGGAFLFRSDMKFGFSPGTSLYIGFGLTWRFGDSR
jgi:hypothetical protein